MKRAALLPILLLVAIAIAISACAQTNALENVLTRMDQAAAGFKSLQAGFTWDQYQKVVNETDTQKGTIYYRKSGSGVEMAADISQPDQKYVLFSNGKKFDASWKGKRASHFLAETSSSSSHLSKSAGRAASILAVSS